MAEEEAKISESEAIELDVLPSASAGISGESALRENINEEDEIRELVLPEPSPFHWSRYFTMIVNHPASLPRIKIAVHSHFGSVVLSLCLAG